MASFSFFSGVNPGQTLVGFESGYLGRDATMVGRIEAAGDNIDLRIYGSVVNSIPVSIAGSDINIVIGATGVVTSTASSSVGYAGVEFLTQGAVSGATGRLFNAGEISGSGMGVYMKTAFPGDMSRLYNTGTITGESTGIYTVGGGTNTIVNSGLITGFLYGVANTSSGFGSTNPVLNLTNTGTISGMEDAVRSGTAADSVVNRGTLLGDVWLGDGDDTFDGRGGSVLGTVFGEGGNDMFSGNAALAEVFDGGAGTDRIDFRTGGRVSVSLSDDSGNSGAALGDSYISFEDVLGSNSGNDVIEGSDIRNVLYGFGGNDVIDGQNGHDALFGGRGIDTLTGGLGNDMFLFQALNEIGDVITDFSSVGAGNNDGIRIRAAGFGGGLVAGPLNPAYFIARADNLAQDANDRFVFRTTDRSLWFDDDGTGAHAAVMVAELQVGATMTAADISVY